MEPVERRIEYYHTVDGRVPYWEWRASLKDTKSRATIDSRLARLRAGNFGYCASVGEGVLELKISYGPGFRIYFGQIGLQFVLLLIGGDKSTQNKDVRKAKVFWHDYQARNL